MQKNVAVDRMTRRQTRMAMPIAIPTPLEDDDAGCSEKGASVLVLL